ncbi:MAG TPA: LysR family transcriptional regulator [Burkholderiaceae bacterium]|nr:LysR family transcriptional regulator [Burkholderiaceae bacterium]
MAHDPTVLFNRLLARGRLRHLQLLAALADAGSVQGAATLVGMSQPAATQALADLETLLGTELFERHSRGVRLSRFGAAVVPVARNVLQALRATTETLSALQAGAQALLRLGTIPAAAAGLLAPTLPAFMQAHPGLQIELIEENSVHLLPELAAGRLDAVVCRRPGELPGNWVFELLLADEPVVVLAPGDALTQRPRVTLRDLDSRAWVLPPQGTGIRAYFDALWAGRERRPTLYPLATTALTVVLEAMRSQAVVSLMPRSFAQSLVDTGQAAIVPLKLPKTGHTALEGLGLLTTGQPDPPPLRELREWLRPLGGRR